MSAATRLGLLAAFLCWAAHAASEEPRGCDKFKWPIERQQALLNAEQKPRLESGGDLVFGAAATAHLAAFAEAHLAMAPERAPTSPASYAIALNLGAPSAAGIFVVSMSGEGWIDVIQDGRFVKPTAFSGALDCPGIRKSVKFSLEAKPAILQLSNVRADEMALIVSPQ